MIDIVVLGLLVVSTTAAVFLLRRRGARGRRLLGASALAFFGLMVVLMMGAHSIEIGYHFVAGDQRADGGPWRYDFQTYALHLLSAVLIVQGLRALRLAMAIAGDAAVRRPWGPVAAILAITAPLVPIQPFFGLIYVVTGVLVLQALAFVPSTPRTPNRA